MMKNKLLKILSILLCFSLIFEQTGFAQIAGQLDISGHLASLRNTFAPDVFRPLHLRFLSYDTLNNNFKLLLDKGSLKNPQSKEIESATKQLLNYFFIGITLPNDAFWVNLRPDAETNIIDDQLAQTDVGRILLESDLQLKKDTARFTSPETPEGKEYWDKLYQKAGEIFGSQNITIPTLTRPWIVPDEIIIRETADSAYIYKATLKVMLEQDYLKDSAVYNFKDDRLKELNEYSSQLIREIIIPKLTQEINASKRYAQLRQVYYSLIMAQWFKARFYDKGGLYSRIIDRKIVTGMTSKEYWSKTTYFQAYQKSFKDGEYNIQEPTYTLYGQTIRSYFSGGEVFNLGRMPPMGGMIRNPETGATVSSIPTATTPALNSKVVIGVKVNATDNPGEVGQVQIENRGIEVSVPDKQEISQESKAQIPLGGDSVSNPGAQVSNVKNLDRLLRILNVLRKSENVPEIPQDASDREILEYCIQEIQKLSLTITDTDADGNTVVNIMGSALYHSNKAVQRFVQAIQKWAVNPDGGVKAINFQGLDGKWIIFGFLSDLQNKDTLEHEQIEIKYRKQGLSWIEAHNRTVTELGKGNTINAGQANGYYAARQDGIGAATKEKTVRNKILVGALAFLVAAGGYLGITSNRDSTRIPIHETVVVSTIRDSESMSLIRDIKNTLAAIREDNAVRKVEDINKALEEIYKSPRAESFRQAVSQERIFSKISETLFSMDWKARDSYVISELINTLKIILKAQKDEIAGETIETRFIERVKALYENIETFKQREILIQIARSGVQRPDGEPYMHHAWLERINEDIAQGKIKGVRDDVRISSDIMEFYHRFLNLGDLIEELAHSNNEKLTQRLQDSGIVVTLFDFATLPSPVNGWVSLTAHAFENMAGIIEARPSLYSQLKHYDANLGLNIIGFCVEESQNTKGSQNSGFQGLTDYKAWNIYSSAATRITEAVKELDIYDKLSDPTSESYELIPLVRANLKIVIEMFKKDNLKPEFLKNVLYVLGRIIREPNGIPQDFEQRELVIDLLYNGDNVKGGLISPRDIFLTYNNPNFKASTQGSGLNRFSLAVSIKLTLARFGQDVTDDNIAKVLPFLLTSTRLHSNDTFLDGQTTLIIVSNNEIYGGIPRFNSSHISRFASNFKVKEENIEALEGPKEKQRILSRIGNTSGKTTIWFNGHGLPNHFWLTGGAPGETAEEADRKLSHPSGISYQELAEALILRAKNNNGGLSDLTLIIESCYGSDFIVNVFNSLKPYYERGEIKDFPLALTVGQRSQPGRDDVLEMETGEGILIRSLKALKEQGKDALTLEDFSRAEEKSRQDFISGIKNGGVGAVRTLLAPKNDFGTFIPLTPRQLNELRGILDSKGNITDGKGHLSLELPVLDGQMKSLGLRDFLDEDTKLNVSDRHAEFEDLASRVSPEVVYGMQASVIQADLDNVGAYHFYSSQYGLIIVVNSNLNKETQDEGKFHETREVYWMGKGFNQHEAHVIASAEQAQRFSRGGSIISYHNQQLGSMSADGLEAIINENEETRQWHYSVLDRAITSGASIDISAVQDYERRLRDYARQLLDSRQDRNETRTEDGTATVEYSELPDGTKISASPHVIQKVKQMDSLIRDREIVAEIGAVGITKETAGGVAIVDLVLPDRIFDMERFMPESREAKLAALIGSEGLRLDLDGDSIALKNSEGDSLLLDEYGWNIVKDHFQKLTKIDKNTLSSYSTLREYLRERGSVTLDPDWDIVITGVSGWFTDTYWKKVNKRAGDLNAGADFLPHHHPQLGLAVAVIQDKPYADREEYYQTMLELSEGDKKFAKQNNIRWMEVRVFGTTDKLGDSSKVTNKVYDMGASSSPVKDDATGQNPSQQLAPQPPASHENPISTTPRQMGGIDFRNLPIVTQAVSNLSANIGSSLSINRLGNINLDSEWREIEKLVNSGITPSAERIKEYVQASCYKGSVDRDIDKVISCISDILRTEEERYLPTDPTLKDILVVLDSANSVQQLRAVFINTTP